MRSGTRSFVAACAASLVLCTPAAAQRPAGPADLEASVAFTLRGIEDADVTAALGDVDGDGRRDAAIADEDGDAVRVLLSGDRRPGARGFRIEGTDVEELTGPEDAGDVNGDGLADVLVPASDDDDSGRAVVVFGRSDPQDVDLRRPEQRDLTIRTARQDASLAGAGDVNGDGLADLVVGGSDEGSDEDSEGAVVHVVFGSRELRGTRDVERLGAGGFEIRGVRGEVLFGLSVSRAGDADGDGLGDLVVGSPLNFPENFEEIDEDDLDAEDFARFQRGRAYVVYGRREATPADVSRPGVATRIDTRRRTSLGFAVTGARDVNGDGLEDVAVTAPGTPVFLPFGTIARGSAFVLFGDRSRPGRIDVDALGARGFTIEGRRDAAITGLSLAGAGDQDGDGRADVLVGELGEDGASLFESDDDQLPGAVQLVYGAASTATVDLGAPGDRAVALRGSGGDTAGASLDAGSDLDADGRPELLIARPGACRVGRLGEGDVAAVELGGPSAPGAGRGGPGDDALSGGPVGEPLFGFGGADLLQSRDGHDCVFGGDGADRLRGGLTGDAVFGEVGDDDVRGDSGCDRIFGGAGADLIVGGPDRASLVVALRAPIGARDRDEVHGGGGDDRISGGMDADDLDGDSGDDRLDGGAADDDADGGTGDDRVDGGSGSDDLVGDEGDDRLRGGAGNDSLDGGEDDDYEDDFYDDERRVPGAPRDPADDDVLEGGSGRDRLFGGDGRDRLLGGLGADVLEDGSGRDLLAGGAGNDLLVSVDGGADVVRCGPGRDRARVDRFDRVSGCEVVRRVSIRRRVSGPRSALSARAARRQAERLAAVVR